MLRCALRVVICFSILHLTGVAQAEWKPGKAPIMTRWAADVSPGKVLPEYPRPQLVRDAWLNLNGLWDYAIRPVSDAQPHSWDGQILVPFPVESALSGVMKPVGPQQKLWYRRTFTLPVSDQSQPDWRNKRILLHCGAIDWQANIWVNGKPVGMHTGGYDPFSFDISAELTAGGEQEIVVAVADPTDASYQPRGKQIQKPHGIWYTPTTGIWQTIWIEPVAQTHVMDLKFVPDVDNSRIRIIPHLGGNVANATVEYAYQDGNEPLIVAGKGQPDRPFDIMIPKPKLWSPESPYLYDYQVTVDDGHGGRDVVRGYFALRKIALGNDSRGHARLELNNRPYFQWGPLDQGFWPDGLYTAPTDEALRYDIEITRKLGFNMARKHVKVEPDRWYYWCDKLGLLVWQDMPSGDRYISDREPDIQRSPESARQFEQEWLAIIRALEDHPSIVMWVPFNEGWGQFDTARIAELTRQADPSRLVNSVSGWADRNVGDVHDYHVYPGPAMPATNPARASVLGEFGGLGLPIEGHTWQAKDNWGYRSYTSQADLQDAYLGLMQRLRVLVANGLSAAVYTQTTDVEIEVNGLLTYDRALIKVDVATVKEAHRKLTLPPPEVKVVLPTSQNEPQIWQFTTSQPAENWAQIGFDASGWKSGPGGFGTASTPGTVVRTHWDSTDIWLRRKITLPPTRPGDWNLSIHHDEDTDVFIDGQRIASLKGYTTAYTTIRLRSEATRALTPGEHTLAVHTRQTGGGQYIDLGLVQLIEKP